MLSNFGKILRKIRIDLNIKLKDMAHDLNISTSVLSNIENGRTQPSIKLIDNICSTYKLPDIQSNSLRASAHKIIMPLDNVSPKARALAFTFARSLPDMNNNTCDKIANLLNNCLT